MQCSATAAVVNKKMLIILWMAIAIMETALNCKPTEARASCVDRSFKESAGDFVT